VRAVLGVCNALALAGCTLLAPLGGLTGDVPGGDGGALGDAAAESAHETGSEASSDGPSDASMIFDTSTDVSPETGPMSGDASPPGWCASQVGLQFCADFDESSVTLGWDSLYSPAGTMTQNDAESTSPPFSALNVLPAVQTGEDTAKLIKGIAVSPGQVHVAFDIRIDKGDMSATAEIVPFALVFGSDNVGYRYLNLDLTVSKAQIFVQTYAVDGGETEGSYPFSNQAIAIQPNQWTHFELDYAISNGSATVGAVLGDASVVEPTLLPTQGPLGPIELDVGGVVYGPTQGWTLRFDNVALTYQP
jgi:hypothetical protein